MIDQKIPEIPWPDGDKPKKKKGRPRKDDTPPEDAAPSPLTAGQVRGQVAGIAKAVAEQAVAEALKDVQSAIPPPGPTEGPGQGGESFRVPNVETPDPGALQGNLPEISPTRHWSIW